MAQAGRSAGRYLSCPCSIFMTQILITYLFLSFNLVLSQLLPLEPLLVQVWNIISFSVWMEQGCSCFSLAVTQVEENLEGKRIDPWCL